jgi:hypothetical protein
MRAIRPADLAVNDATWGNRARLWRAVGRDARQVRTWPAFTRWKMAPPGALGTPEKVFVREASGNTNQ